METSYKTLNLHKENRTVQLWAAIKLKLYNITILEELHLNKNYTDKQLTTGM